MRIITPHRPDAPDLLQNFFVFFKARKAALAMVFLSPPQGLRTLVQSVRRTLRPPRSGKIGDIKTND